MFPVKSANIMFLMCTCAFVSNSVAVGILWDKDIIYDVNTNSFPLASCLNEDSNGMFLITKTGPKGSFLIKGGDCIFWEIGVDGNIRQKVPLINEDGNAIRTNVITAGSQSAMALDSLGNLLTIGVLGEQRKGKSLDVISTEKIAEPNILASKRIGDFSVKKLITLKNDTFALIGARSGNGLFLRIDNQGKIIQEKLFNRGQDEIFTGADVINSDNLNLVVVGLSPKIRSATSLENTTECFILLYDPNDKIVYEDYFLGGNSSITVPKVCSLGNGNVVMAFYTKPNKDVKAAFRARCYSQELKLLWEKEILTIDTSPTKLPFYFDMISRDSKGFLVVVMTPVEGLKFYSFKEDGSKVGYSEYKGMVGVAGFNLLRMHDRTIVVCQEGSEGNIKELSIKAKVIALN